MTNHVLQMKKYYEYKYFKVLHVNQVYISPTDI